MLKKLMMLIILSVITMSIQMRRNHLNYLTDFVFVLH